MPAPVLVYGGTFDPVHAGHVQVAQAAADALGAGRILLIPAGDPPHRGAPRVAGALRAQMLRLAFADDPRCEIDERELHRQGPSYTVDTLRELRAELGPDTPLVLLLGRDAANGLPSWHEPRDLPALAHLLVVARPGASADEHIAIELGWQHADRAGELRHQAAGRVYSLPQALSAASSTAVRAALQTPAGESAVLPAAVQAFIDRHRLYR